MSHRMKRWTCCDVRDEAKHMTNGCRQRRHLAEENAAPYEAYETAAKASYDERDKALDAELNQLCGGDWERQLLTAARLQLKNVEADLAQQRATAARYDNIKFE
jgi:glucan phosphorylase